ncbi:unnamed protein product [Lymnaea stagnalis]|uniref:Peptidase S1 domain-containing protein n=1 Tax=Lymnaea stagnalis TaxID=6523 RepID=A0AAV2IJJ2_LYMST
MLALAIIFSLIAPNLALTEQQSKLMKRIVNGQPTKLFERPYQASLQVLYFGQWYHICGASIIDVDRLLTAAHCLIFPVETMRVKVGLLDLTAPPNQYQQTIDIKAFKAHENFSTVIVDGMPNDIGILYTKTPFHFNENVQPVKIAPGGLTFDNSKCVISGWGKTSGTSAGSNILMEVAMTKITLKQCKEEFVPLGVAITDNAICVFDGENPPGENPTACSGDSGGPMLCSHRRRDYLAGITSFGLENCGGYRPSVYTRVAPYISWISKNKRAPNTQLQLEP